MGASKQAESGNIKKFEIYSNSGEPIDLTGAGVLTELVYYESILDLTVRASATFVDTGNRINGEGIALVEELSSGNKTNIRIEDNYGNTLSFSNDNHLRVKQPRNILQDTLKSTFTIDLYSRDFIANDEEGKTLVEKKYSGKITDTVEKIIKQDSLKSEKSLLIDDSINTLEVIGRRRKPFSVICELATKCCPDIEGAFGTLAGYFFYETYEGYNFRSIDKLFMQSPKKKLIFNNTDGLPEGYDAKILEYSFDIGIDLDNKIKSGAIGKSKLITLDTFNNTYQGENENEFDVSGQYKGKNNAGKEEIKFPSDLDIDVTKVYTKIPDTGINPPGKNAKEQLKNSQKVNFDIDKIVRQSKARYNNLFNVKLSIAIVGDLSLRAGDLLHCDFPEVSSKKNTIVSKKKSGLYMIVDVATLFNSAGTFTRINLVRDTIGRKPA
jgi:hypothetical protein